MTTPPDPVWLEMPDRITDSAADAVVRALGFAPHQVRKLIIDLDSSELVVEVSAHTQHIVRTYTIAPPSVAGVRAVPSEQVPL